MTATYESIAKAGFGGISPQTMKDLEYLELLAAQTGTNISQWPVIDLLNGVSAGDKKALNKIFFSQLTPEEKPNPIDANPKFKADLPKFQKFFGDHRKERIKQLQAGKDTSLRTATNYAAAWYEHLAAAKDQQMEIDLLQGKTEESLLDDIRAALTSTFWEFQSFDGNTLHLLTAQDVLMTEKNQSAGIDRTVNLGRYIVAYNLRTASLKLHRHERNLTSRGHYHPYVAGNGDVCWGNSAGTVAGMLSKGEHSKILNLLSALLTTFAPDSNPYVSLHFFWQVQEDQKKKLAQPATTPVEDVSDVWTIAEEEPEEPEDECSTCGNREDDCSCHYCEACDERYYPEPCEEHWCDACNDCHNDGYGENHCEDCDELHEDCNRCRECGHHDGEHERDCSERPRPETEQQEEEE